jgi:putative transcriptional regulator
MDLTGKLLIAMPGMGDPRFEHSVIFLCVHTPEAAMGLIVNKPAPELRFDSLLKQLGIPHGDRSRDIHVHFGGPVEHARGFVLHSGEYEGQGSTLHVGERFGMTATLDVLQALADGEGPERSMLALGYAGWGPGQLEGEIRDNGWLTCDADEELIFGLPDARKWTSALKSIGVDPVSLSATAGHA